MALNVISKYVAVEPQLKGERAKLFDAIKSGCNEDVQRLLRSENISLSLTNEYGCTLLGVAVSLGQSVVAATLIQRGVNVNLTDFYGQTALHNAVEANNASMVELLISKGADVNAMDVKRDGLPAIHIAACKGYLDVAKLLIAAGCDVNAQDINGTSVLHCAVSNGHLELTKCLLKAHAKVNVVANQSRRTPLFLAIDDTASAQMTQLLLSYNAKVNVKDVFGMTSLCFACIKENTECAKCLLNARAKVDIPDLKGYLPVHYAARSGNLLLVEQLMEHGSLIDVLTKYCDSPLHLAVRMCRLDMVSFLVANGCDVNLSEPHGQVTPLHLAASGFDDSLIFEELLKLLLLGDCWLDAHGPSSLETPLYRALDAAHYGSAILLLQYGADPNVECPFEVTLLQKACQRGCHNLVYTLLHTDLNWYREGWLNKDIYESGINPKLLVGVEYARHIPTVLLNDLNLHEIIESWRHNAASLMHNCRLVIRKSLAPHLYKNLLLLRLPPLLQRYILLQNL